MLYKGAAWVAILRDKTSQNQDRQLSWFVRLVEGLKEGGREGEV